MSSRPKSAPPTGPSTKGAEPVQVPSADESGNVEPLTKGPEPSAPPPPEGGRKRRRTMKKRKSHRRKTHHRRR